MTTTKAYLFLIAATPFFIVLDRLSKWLATEYLRSPVKMLPGFELVYRENTGIAWGMSVPYMPLIILNVILLIFIIYFAFRYLDLSLYTTQIALALVTGGAIGNMIDRGYVIDFISIWIWPVFNPADAFLVIGIFIIVLFYGKIKKKSEK